ncbi:MAG: DUF91 domain-containing protein [Candidatus Altiarchaeales archaeon HGW-Altiarchaeales-3]|nr:MAG: DUF91 domain-containing protein [Candidatus Altiarchaeales archaeon HGW-Altiarchaeales-3]
MATTHVFIVDKNTFKYHLEYLFAGTGAKDYVLDFNNASNSRLNPTREKLLISMIADLNRVRIGDYVIFYLQQSKEVGEGKFYGIFKAKSNGFLDNNDNEQFLKTELQKSLTFRVLLEPFEVYPAGVTEWEALDEIRHIQSPNQLLWSLIYRKLKANRGNTMITIYETERIFKLIRDKNNRQKINSEYFSFDMDNQKIIPSNVNNTYTGRSEEINILPRLIKKHDEKKAFESHLQAYICQNVNNNIQLKSLLIQNNTLEWIGNEVSCGVGMQRIDIALSLKKENQERLILPIELKAVPASLLNVPQIQRYVDWLEQYYIPNRISTIQPVLIAKKFDNKESEKYLRIVESFKQFNLKNPNCLSLKYIEFEILDNDLIFEEHIHHV